MRGRTGRVAGRALSAPGQCPGRKLACAGGAVCCGKEAKKVPAKPPARTCVDLSKSTSEASCPWRELTAEALRRGTGAIGARAIIRTSARLRGVRGRTGQAALSPSARAGSCAPGTSASCLRQGREGPSETTGADVRQRPAQARASARRCVAARGKPPSRLRQGRGRPVKPSARGLHPRHAGFLPAARPERSQRNYRRGRELTSRSSAGVSSPLRGRTGHAAFLRSARAERTQQN